eukprot:CAMPEP_0113892966 /NCGR_PEP_ID=MMETSP0780_2-20120614/15769_1 /TAXON_ID=652834 /ORGANISM="Palpitomonas bilix" /LENGTH=1000 /DNA_ID=CAMNT_0000883081 /DNA_START=332 /DNA_END=3334 /DNA_ORIENTATION=- /assembly_acc=CAM_ASM_000599
MGEKNKVTPLMQELDELEREVDDSEGHKKDTDRASLRYEIRVSRPPSPGGEEIVAGSEGAEGAKRHSAHVVASVTKESLRLSLNSLFPNGNDDGKVGEEGDAMKLEARSRSGSIVLDSPGIRDIEKLLSIRDRKTSDELQRLPEVERLRYQLDLAEDIRDALTARVDELTCKLADSQKRVTNLINDVARLEKEKGELLEASATVTVASVEPQGGGRRRSRSNSIANAAFSGSMAASLRHLARKAKANAFVLEPDVPEDGELEDFDSKDMTKSHARLGYARPDASHDGDGKALLTPSAQNGGLKDRTVSAPMLNGHLQAASRELDGVSTVSEEPAVEEQASKGVAHYRSQSSKRLFLNAKPANGHASIGRESSDKLLPKPNGSTAETFMKKRGVKKKRSINYDGPSPIEIAAQKAEAEHRRRQMLDQKGKCFRFWLHVRSGVIHPDAKFRMAWTIMIMMIIMFSAIYLPFSLAFSYTTDELGVLEAIITSMFLLDMIFNFRTGYYDGESGELVKSKKRIAINYVRTWFFIDLASSFPFELITVATNALTSGEGEAATDVELIRLARLLRVPRAFRVLRMLRLLRLLKVAKVSNYLMQILSKVDVHVLKLFNLVAFILFISHVSSCIWFALAAARSFSNETWVGTSMVVPDEVLTVEGLENPCITSTDFCYEAYILSMYLTTSTLSTIAYGDIHPINVEERLFAAFYVLVSAGVFAYFLGSMTTILSLINRTTAEFREKRGQVTRFLYDKHVPDELQNRILAYYDYCHSRNILAGNNESTTLMHELNTGLRQDLAVYLAEDTIGRVPIFKGKDRRLILELMDHLVQEVFAPGELIVTEGEVGTCMYFITRGWAEVVLGILRGEEVTLDTLKEGDIFGEVALLTRQKRNASIRAFTYVETLKLRKEDLEKVLVRYPEVNAEITSKAAMMMKKTIELRSHLQLLGKGGSNGSNFGSRQTLPVIKDASEGDPIEDSRVSGSSPLRSSAKLPSREPFQLKEKEGDE